MEPKMRTLILGQVAQLPPFYDKLSVILSKDAGDTLGTFSTRVGLEEEVAAAAPFGGETMSMSQLCGDYSLLPVDHEQWEAPSVTLHLVLLSPSAPWSSTDDEAEEMEETHVTAASPTVTETQERAGRATTTHGHLERRPTHTTAEHCGDFHSKQKQSREGAREVLAESSAERADVWQDELRESRRKEDVILKQVQDTTQHLKDMVDKSRVELQRSPGTFNDAFQSVQKYLNKQIPHPKGKSQKKKKSTHLACVRDKWTITAKPVPPNSVGSQEGCITASRARRVSLHFREMGRFRVMMG